MGRLRCWQIDAAPWTDRVRHVSDAGHRQLLTCLADGGLDAFPSGGGDGTNSRSVKRRSFIQRARVGHGQTAQGAFVRYAGACGFHLCFLL